MFSKTRNGLLLAIAGSMLFAFKPILIKLIYGYGLDTLTILTWRMIFSLPCYLAIGVWVFLGRKAPLTKDSYRALSLAMVLGILGYYCAAFADLYGLQFVSAQLGRMILFTYPTLVTLLGWWLLDTSVSRVTIVALVVSYIGIGMIFLHDLVFYGTNVLQGAIWIFVSAICFSCFMVFSKPVIAAVGSRLFTCVAMTSASLAIILHFTVSNLVLSDNGLNSGVPEFTPLIHVFLLAIFCTVIPSFLVAAAIHRIGSSPTSIVGCVGPVVTAGFAVAILSEQFTIYHFIGMLLVIGAVTLSGLNTVRKPLT